MVEYLDESLNKKVEDSKLFFKQQQIIQMMWIVFFFLLVCIYAYFNGISIIIVCVLTITGMSVLLLYT
jgi:hypothetical protein